MAAFLPPFVVENMWFIMLVASLITWPLAWVADNVFADSAFGIFGNYVFLMSGSLLGGTGLMLHLGSASPVLNQPHLPFFAAAAGAAACMLLACFVKRLLFR
ncbi:MAG: hypothetical protein AAF590_06255 [Pseudomonadota bacterium]